MKKIVKFPCGFEAFEGTLPEKFSIIYNMIPLSVDRNLWEKDLYELYISGWRKKVITSSFFPMRYNGKIALDVTSLESLYEVVSLFNEHGFKINIGDCIGRIKREWIYRDKEINHLPYRNDFYQFFVYIKSKENYFKFRELLISKELKNLGYYIFQSIGEDQGIYGDITKLIDILV